MPSITVYQQPVPKARARFSKKTNRPFTPRTTELAEYHIREEWLRQHGLGIQDINEPYVGPVSLSVKVYLARPTIHYGSGRNADRLRASAPVRPTGAHGDWDNFGKTASDALDGVAFRNDGMIVDGRIEKFYCNDDPPRWVIKVEQA